MVQLPTLANKITKLMTGFEYSHSSMSFDENLETLYSFQIKNQKVLLVGGFVKETHDMYFHGKNISLNEMVFRIPVGDNEYKRINDFVLQLSNDHEYIFNYVSALFMFTLGGVKSYKAYHCIEFISEVLALVDSIKLPKSAYKMRPKDLYCALEPFMIRNGQICSSDFEFKENPFMKKIKFSVAVKKSLYSIKESICRAALQRTSKNFNYRNVNFYDEDTVGTHRAVQ